MAALTEHGGDIRRARLLLRSVTQTNPGHGPGWIAAVRLEEHAGDIAAARDVVRRAIEACPDTEDVWVEAARVLPRHEARRALSSATRRMPDSVAVWLAAADVEGDDETARKKVLRGALEVIPGSARLWRACVELEGPENARLLLGVAVDKAPHSVDLWLALANLESHERAREVLNKARHALPAEPRVWVAAAQLEETRGDGGPVVQKMVPRIVKKAVKALSAAGAIGDRAFWLAEAERCERAECPITCAAIIEYTSRIGFENVPEGAVDPLGAGDDDGNEVEWGREKLQGGRGGFVGFYSWLVLLARVDFFFFMFLI
jgi:pre-mRNA-processing factor 6